MAVSKWQEGLAMLVTEGGKRTDGGNAHGKYINHLKMIPNYTIMVKNTLLWAFGLLRIDLGIPFGTDVGTWLSKDGKGETVLPDIDSNWIEFHVVTFMALANGPMVRQTNPLVDNVFTHTNLEKSYNSVLFYLSENVSVCRLIINRHMSKPLSDEFSTRLKSHPETVHVPGLYAQIRQRTSELPRNTGGEERVPEFPTLFNLLHVIKNMPIQDAKTSSIGILEGKASVKREVMTDVEPDFKTGVKLVTPPVRNFPGMKAEWLALSDQEFASKFFVIWNSPIGSTASFAEIAFPRLELVINELFSRSESKRQLLAAESLTRLWASLAFVNGLVDDPIWKNKYVSSLFSMPNLAANALIFMLKDWSKKHVDASVNLTHKVERTAYMILKKAAPSFSVYVANQETSLQSDFLDLRRLLDDLEFYRCADLVSVWMKKGKDTIFQYKDIIPASAPNECFPESKQFIGKGGFGAVYRVCVQDQKGGTSCDFAMKKEDAKSQAWRGALFHRYLHEHYAGMGIVPELMHVKSCENGTISQTVMELYTGTVWGLYKKHYYLSQGVVDAMFYLMLCLDAAGVVHGDIKLDQFLYKILLHSDSTKPPKMLISIADFGFSGWIDAQDTKNPWTSAFPYEPEQGWPRYNFDPQPYVPHAKEMLGGFDHDSTLIHSAHPLRPYRAHINIWQLHLSMTKNNISILCADGNRRMYGYPSNDLLPFQIDDIISAEVHFVDQRNVDRLTGKANGASNYVAALSNATTNLIDYPYNNDPELQILNGKDLHLYNIDLELAKRSNAFPSAGPFSKSDRSQTEDPLPPAEPRKAALKNFQPPPLLNLSAWKKQRSGLFGKY